MSKEDKHSPKHLDQYILDFILEKGGTVRKEYLFTIFDHYSRGYLYDRIQVLKRNNFIIEVGGELKTTKKVK